MIPCSTIPQHCDEWFFPSVCGSIESFQNQRLIIKFPLSEITGPSLLTPIRQFCFATEVPLPVLLQASAAKGSTSSGTGCERISEHLDSSTTTTNFLRRHGNDLFPCVRSSTSFYSSETSYLVGAIDVYVQFQDVHQVWVRGDTILSPKE